MDQDNAGTENPIAPDSASSTNEETATKTTVEPVTFPSQTTPPQSENQTKTNNALKITTVICAILAIAGIAFGVYEFLDSNQKTAQISTLKNEISNKETTITDLEKEVSNLEDKISAIEENSNVVGPTETPESQVSPIPETKPESQENTIDIISEIADTDTTKVYKIGECTADGGAASHVSIKCPVTISGKKALISYHDDDRNLRLSLPKE